MKTFLLVLCLSLGAKANVLETVLQQKWEKPSKGDWQLFIASQVMIVTDLSLSLHLKNLPELRETNLILGSHPSGFKLVGYTLLVEAVYIPLWYYLPNPYRNLLAGGVFGVECYVSINNLFLTVRF